MAKKKQKIKRTKKESKKKKTKKKKIKDNYTVEISKMQSDVKTFIEKFKADVNKKKKSYQKFRVK